MKEKVFKTDNAGEVKITIDESAITFKAETQEKPVRIPIFVWDFHEKKKLRGRPWYKSQMGDYVDNVVRNSDLFN